MCQKGPGRERDRIAQRQNLISIPASPSLTEGLLFRA